MCNVVAAKDKGFTLIEVLVAFSILSMTLAALLSLLSTGARNTQIADEYSRAVVWAESRLAELGVTRPLRKGVTHGSFDADYQWELRVIKRPPRKTSISMDKEWDTLDVTLRIWWLSMGQERELSLSTVRLVAEE